MFKDSFGSKNTHTSIKYRCYENLNEDKFAQDLETALWVQLQNIDNVDDCLEALYKLFLRVVDRHFSINKKTCSARIVY